MSVAFIRLARATPLFPFVCVFKVYTLLISSY